MSRTSFLFAVTGPIVAIALSGGCSNAAKNPPKAESTQDLLKELSKSPDDVARVGAARKLGTAVGDRAAVQGLIQALNDKSEYVQTAAATSLRGAKDPAVAPALWAAVNDPRRRSKFRVAAAVTLGSLRDPLAPKLLLRLLPEDPYYTSEALKELGQAAVPELVEALRDSDRRDKAADILLSIGGGVDQMIPMLSPKEGKFTRLTVARLLGESGDPKAADALKAASKTDLEVVTAAYRFFIRQGEPGTETELIRALNTYGTVEMASDFVFSGNDKLKKAGTDWARIRSMTLVPVSQTEVHWSGLDPGVKRLGLYHFDDSLASTTGVSPAQSASVSFVPGKWGKAIAVEKGGILKYPVKGNLDFKEGTVEMWVSPRLDGSDPLYRKYNHALLIYSSPAPAYDQFLVSEAIFGGFYAGTVVNKQYRGAGGGNIAGWKTGTWHHVAFTWSATETRQRFYVDGNKVMENSGPMPIPGPGGATFTVGCDPYTNWTAFLVDELQISSGEKSPDGIRSGASRPIPFADQ